MKNLKFKRKETKKQQSSGITLIALVITIIVLLILAGISIAMLSGDNSILSKATDAKTLTERASVVEQARTDVLGYQAENKGGDLDKSQLKAVLDKYFDRVPDLTDMEKDEILNTELQTLAKYGSYTITIYEIYNGSFTNLGSSGNIWTQNSDGTITNGTVILKIGDYIKYNPINSEITSITSYETENGYGTQIFEIFKYQPSDYTNNDKWQVLGVKNGQVEIISTDIIPSNNEDEMFYLSGRIGYKNAEQELTKIAGLYGHGANATGARSINVDDINEITGYNPNTGAENGKQYGNSGNNEIPDVREYGNKVTYKWNGIDDKPSYTSTNGAEGKTDTSHNNNKFGNKSYWFDFTSNDWKESAFEPKREETIATLTGNYYYYYPETLTTQNSTGATIGIANTSPERKMLFDNSVYRSYWLASRCVTAYESGGWFKRTCCC